jgi:hypothetical protein
MSAIEKEKHTKLYKEAAIWLQHEDKLPLAEFVDSMELAQIATVIVKTSNGIAILQSRLNYTDYIHEKEDYEREVQITHLPLEFASEIVSVIVLELSKSWSDAKQRLYYYEPSAEDDDHRSEEFSDD